MMVLARSDEVLLMCDIVLTRRRGLPLSTGRRRPLTAKGQPDTWQGRQIVREAVRKIVCIDIVHQEKEP
jgi:hypothetical protein